MKYCKRCDRTLDRSSFTTSRTRYDGLQPYCQGCMKDYRKEHYRSNSGPYKERAVAKKRQLQEYIKEIKEGSKCVDCGIEYPYYVLDFDHLGKGEKLSNISNMTRMGSLTKIKEEIAKCEVVCANCHRERTWQRNNNVR